jgi:ribosomal protein L32
MNWVIIITVIVVSCTVFWRLRKGTGDIFAGDRQLYRYFKYGPPIMRKGDALFLLALLLLLLPPLLRYNSRRDWFGFGDVEKTLSFVIMLVIFIPLMGAYFVRRRRWQRNVIDSGFAICPDCGYSLVGLPSHHICPECGQPYDLDAVRRNWHLHLGDL